MCGPHPWRRLRRAHACAPRLFGIHGAGRLRHIAAETPPIGRPPRNGGKIGMLSHEHNEMLCRVGRGTPMGEFRLPAGA